jgi:hypothetical protein
MKRKHLAVALAAALFAATPVLAAEGQQTTQNPLNCDFEPACEVAPGYYGGISSPASSKFNLSVGGFIKLDYAYNSVNYGSSYAFQTPQSQPKDSSLPGNRDQTAFSARQSRLWFKANGPTLLGAKTVGLVEFDAGDNGGSILANQGNPNGGTFSDNINPFLRLRHAYANLDWGKTQVLFGQTGDIWAPAAIGSIDFRGGGGQGIAGSRNPQLRVTHRIDLGKDNAIKIVAGAQTPYQANNYNSGGTNGVVDSWTYLPNFAGQVLFVSKALGTAPTAGGFGQSSLTAGFFGIYGSEDVAGEPKRLDTWGGGFYSFVPILKSSDGKSRAGTLAFEGQVYEAANLVVTGGTGSTAAAFVGKAGSRDAAKGYGAAASLYFYPTQNLGINAGYSRRGAVDNASYRVANKNYEVSNDLAYANLQYDLNAAVRVAVEYQRLHTQFGNVADTSASFAGGGSAGLADSGTANVARAALYYFF